MNTDPVDQTALWLSRVFLGAQPTEADALMLTEIEEDSKTRPLSLILEEMETRRREEPGQFGLDHVATLFAPLFLPVVYAFVRKFAGKFVEGAASEAGKMAATRLKESVAKALAEKAGSGAAPEAIAELEQAFAARARLLGLGRSSYDHYLRQLRERSAQLL